MLLAVITAASLGALLLGISYIILPNQPGQMPTPKPIPEMLNQILSAFLWIGLAASIATIIVVTVFLVSRIKNRKSNNRTSASSKLRDKVFGSSCFNQFFVFLLNLSCFRLFFQ